MEYTSKCKQLKNFIGSLIIPNPIFMFCYLNEFNYELNDLHFCRILDNSTLVEPLVYIHITNNFYLSLMITTSIQRVSILIQFHCVMQYFSKLLQQFEHWSFCPINEIYELGYK